MSSHLEPLLGPFRPSDDIAFPSRVGLVGGGRWARVLLSVLDELLPEGTEIRVASPGLFSRISGWTRDGEHGRAISAHESTAALCRDPKPGAVLVANGAARHTETARTVLEAGIPVFVEKPLATTEAGAAALFDLAEARHLVMAAGHVFQFARFAVRFAERLAPLPRPRAVDILWTDRVGEIRHGEAKSFDPFTPVAADVFPHVWSLLRMVLPEGGFSVETVDVNSGGASVEVVLISADTVCRATLARLSDARRRRVRAVVEGDTFELDFAAEPGVVRTPDGESSGDPDWSPASSPLRTEIAHFFRAIQQGRGLHPSQGRSVIESARLVEQISLLYRAAQKDFLMGALGDGARDPAGPGPEVFYALREAAGPALLEHGLIASPFDEAATRRAIGRLWHCLTAKEGDPEMRRAAASAGFQTP